MADETQKTPEATPAATTGYKHQTTPSPVMRGLSQSLMQGAFAKFGAAFTDTGDVKKDAATRESRLAPFMQAGTNVANALQQRWQTMEYENFQKEYVEPYHQEKKAMYQDYQNRNAQLDEGFVQGPTGELEPVDLTSKEGRLMAVRQRGQLESRYYQINGDLDLELFNKAAKWENNPQIMKRIEMIRDTTADMLAKAANPDGTMQKEEGMSKIRARENENEIGRERNRISRQAAADAKPARSYQEAVERYGPEGIMSWLTSDPIGWQTMNAGGAKFLNKERQAALNYLLKQNPEADAEDPEILRKLEAMQPQWIGKAAAAFLESQSPSVFAAAKKATPHFFDATQSTDAAKPGIVANKRQDPKERKKNVKSWNKHAEAHFKEYLANPDNDPSIEAVMADLEEWLRRAVLGGTDEPFLQALVAEEGKGTEKYVSEVLEDVPKYIRRWWSSKDGSELAQELNPDESRESKSAAKNAPGGPRGVLFRGERPNKKDGLKLP